MEDYNTKHFRKALDLYWDENYQELFKYCEKACLDEIENIELWKLFGVAAGMTQRQSIAFKCHETVFNLEPENDLNLINFLTSLFHNDMAENAIEVIHKFESRFDNEHIIRMFRDLLIAAGEQYEIDSLICHIPSSIMQKL